MTQTRSKKPKLVELPDIKRNIWISPSHIKNYFLNDTIVDWLKYNKNSYKKQNNEQKDDIFIEKGKTFEKDIVKYIHDRRIEIVTVSDKITKLNCDRVVELMKNGIPVIHSAPFIDKKNKTKGVIDLLVRSDMLNLISDTNYLSINEQKINSPNLNSDYHYIVIDIKFSTLPLKSDGIHLLNSGNYNFYKAQVYIYTNAIGNIQGYTPNMAFILGRRSKYINKGIVFKSLNCLEKMGKVDFKKFDSHIKIKLTKAVKWVKDVMNYGKIWELPNPTRPELFPNMSIDSGNWNTDKREIADMIGEITTIWNCGLKHRENAFKKGIFSWKDRKCNSSVLGFKKETAKIVDSILDINRNGGKIFPQKIGTNLFDWRKEENEAFIDFENFIDIFSDNKNLPIQEKTDMIFLIGLYYKGEYIKFLAESKNSERDIFRQLTDFLQEKGIKKLWYWHAENLIWKKITEKYNLTADKYIWCDLLKFFKTEPIVIQGCFDFSLKNIGNAMCKNGLIDFTLNTQCISGFQAGIKAWKCYDTEKPNTDNLSDIINYNKYDVELLYHILNYFRIRM